MDLRLCRAPLSGGNRQREGQHEQLTRAGSSYVDRNAVLRLPDEECAVCVPLLPAPVQSLQRLQRTNHGSQHPHLPHLAAHHTLAGKLARFHACLSSFAVLCVWVAANPDLCNSPPSIFLLIGPLPQPTRPPARSIIIRTKLGPLKTIQPRSNLCRVTSCVLFLLSFPLKRTSLPAAPSSLNLEQH